MTTVKSNPTLPPSWSPTVAGCLSTSDFWQWDYGSKEDARTVLGGPSQTTNCLPTSWASDVIYSGSECPLYYTSACQGNDSFSAVTCCPSYVLFCCPGRRALRDPEVADSRLHGVVDSILLSARARSWQEITVPNSSACLRGRPQGPSP